MLVFLLFIYLVGCWHIPFFQSRIDSFLKGKALYLIVTHLLFWAAGLMFVLFLPGLIVTYAAKNLALSSSIEASLIFSSMTAGVIIIFKRVNHFSKLR